MELRTTWRRMLAYREGGFTIIEVLIIVVLIGILIGIASSSWSGLIESRRVDSATNQVVADLRLAHTSATNQLSPWRVVYYRTGQQVTGCGLGASPPPADYCMVKFDGSTVVKEVPRQLPDGTELWQSNTNLLDAVLTLPGLQYSRSLEFCPNGSLQATEMVPVTLSACNAGMLSTVPQITVRAEDNAPCNRLELTPATSRVGVVARPANCGT